ncbi:roadblock/LC7 domain-containing protein [Streptomyces sp. 8N706]|uniref:roadblock/LC7 domain-containing protein n=1 Tax=Streptomyces sp. 8N706 TaxID=3457416 RepID=UPI003FCFD135
MTEPRETSARYGSGDLDGMLDDLVIRIREVRHALVLSREGLAVGASEGLSREDTRHLSAVASGFHALATCSGPRSPAGDIHRTVVEMAGGLLFVAVAGDGTGLVVLGTVDTDMGLLAHEMARLLERVGSPPVTPSRCAVRHPPAAG